MRIIAGTLRGRRLVAPKGQATRPTTDRVREAWFSILGPLEGTVLDLYAGTGALGFEALSRGAERAVFVESSRAAQAAIEKNAETLGVSQRVVLIKAEVESCRASLTRLGPFELVLTDPPWTAIDQSEKALARLPWPEIVAPQGQVVIGHPKKRPVDLRAPSLTLVKQRAWGDSAATFLVRDATAQDDTAPDDTAKDDTAPEAT